LQRVRVFFEPAIRETVFISSSKAKSGLRLEHLDTEHLLGYMTSGWLLGQLALLDGLPSSASAHLQRPL